MSGKDWTPNDIKRVINAWARTAADHDPEDLVILDAILKDALYVKIPEIAMEQKARNGWSWAMYAQAFGVTRWAAMQRLDLAWKQSQAEKKAAKKAAKSNTKETK